MLQVLFAISSSDPGIQDFEAACKSRLFMFHAKVGLHFSSAKSPALPTEVLAVPRWSGYGVSQTCGYVDVHACSVYHVGVSLVSCSSGLGRWPFTNAVTVVCVLTVAAWGS